eukprot:749821-Hanusia_phi.AAC.9
MAGIRWFLRADQRFLRQRMYEVSRGDGSFLRQTFTAGDAGLQSSKVTLGCLMLCLVERLMQDKHKLHVSDIGLRHKTAQTRQGCAGKGKPLVKLSDVDVLNSHLSGTESLPCQVIAACESLRRGRLSCFKALLWFALPPCNLGEQGDKPLAIPPPEKARRAEDKKATSPAELRRRLGCQCEPLKGGTKRRQRKHEGKTRLGEVCEHSSSSSTDSLQERRSRLGSLPLATRASSLTACACRDTRIR